MKIDHEETKRTKKEQKNHRALRLFVVDFLRSVHVAFRRLETMRINHEETKGTKKRPEKTFVLFVSSWSIS
jgi:hypothetical protein